jgi:peroxiredoxin
MKALQQDLKRLEAADTQVLGVSMDSSFSNKAFADQIGVTFPLLSDWGGDVTHQYGIYVDKYKAARRVNFLIGKDGKILEEQVDKDAIDPTKIVDTCERPKLKN